MADSLASHFRAALPAAVSRETPEPDDLEAVLASAIADAKSKWPGIEIPSADFARYLAARVSEGLEGRHVSDLYLACACTLGNARAFDIFDRTYALDLANAVRRIDTRADFVDEAVQTVREKLLVSSGGAPPRIGEYQGRAALRTWLHAIAARTALNLTRAGAAGKLVELDSDAGTAHLAASPELSYLKARYKPELEAALRHVLSELEPRERALLRLSFVDGQSVDRIGALYKVGRSTAARWLADARTALFEGVRCDLCVRLSLRESEFDSLAAAVRSDVDLSILRLLRDAG